MKLHLRRMKLSRHLGSVVAPPGKEAGSGKRLRRWLRSPILHFAVIGAALFGARALPVPYVLAPRKVERKPIVISAERVRLMQADFVQRWGATPAPEQWTALIEQAVDDELLYREARALALDFEDGSVRRRLVEKMRAVSDRPGRNPAELSRDARALGLDDDVVIRRLLVAKMRLLLQQDPQNAALPEGDLQAYLDRHRERFVQPAELTFSHVFLSAGTHGAHLDKDAQAILKQLRTRSPQSEATSELSDPFPLGQQMRAYSYHRIVSRFGKSFADQVFDLPRAAWSQPIASPYGLHLVWIEEKTPERVPPLHAVRQRVVQSVMAERADIQLARGLERLRSLYEIRVEGREDLSVPRTESAAQR